MITEWERPSRAYRRLTVSAVLATYLLVVAGGVVRVSGSGLGCGATGQDWPLCHGRLVPPPDVNTLIEFTHRMLATTSTLLIGAVLVATLIRYRQQRSLVVTSCVAAGLLVLQVALGAITVELRLPGGIVLLHLANALLLLATLVLVAVLAATVGTARSLQWRTSDRPARAGIAAAIAAYALVLSGGFVVARGAGAACSAWPLCGNGFELSGSGLASVNLLHRIVAAIVIVAVAASMPRIRRAFPGDRAVALVTRTINIALVAQVIAGALVVELHLPAWARGLHLGLASGLWALVVVLALLSRRADPEVGLAGRGTRAIAQGAAVA